MTIDTRISLMVENDQSFTQSKHQPEESDERFGIISDSPPLIRTARTASPPPAPCRAPSRESETTLSVDRLSLTSPEQQSSAPSDMLLSSTHQVTSGEESPSGSETASQMLQQQPSPRSDQRARQESEEEESIALARMLMAQEAMESYVLSADHLRYNQDMYSPEDLAALQAAMADEEPEALDEDGDSSDRELSYDAMLRLGETIGDVKQERWSFVATKHILRLPTCTFALSAVKDKDENDPSVKCIVCQCAYDDGECLRRLPCGHVFHKECVDQWLLRTDVCPYCRQTIIPPEEQTETTSSV